MTKYLCVLLAINAVLGMVISGFILFMAEQSSSRMFGALLFLGCATVGYLVRRNCPD
jgi:hypothetical protein